MECFNPDLVPNGSDDSGRYDFKAQKNICKWNCEVTEEGEITTEEGGITTEEGGIITEEGGITRLGFI